MKQILIITLFAITTISCNAQNTKQSKFDFKNFEKQVLSYEPKQKEGLSKKDYDFGVMVINNIKRDVKNNPKNFDPADYFNVLSAFLSLQENKENILLAFDKFIRTGKCETILVYQDMFLDIDRYKAVRKEFLVELTKCESSEKIIISFNIKDYCEKNNLDRKLVELINEINNSDIKYRSDESVDWSKQTPLDKNNQKIIDSLYQKYNTYIGKSLVGEKFSIVMWSVIQHSNVDIMERYLPVIHQAFKDNEIKQKPLEMLIDRFYGLKYGYQIFGSQSGFGFEMADEKKRKEIEKKYGIE